MADVGRWLSPSSYTLETLVKAVHLGNRLSVSNFYPFLFLFL